MKLYTFIPTEWKKRGENNVAYYWNIAASPLSPTLLVQGNCFSFGILPWIHFLHLHSNTLCRLSSWKQMELCWKIKITLLLQSCKRKIRFRVHNKVKESNYHWIVEFWSRNIKEVESNLSNSIKSNTAERLYLLYLSTIKFCVDPYILDLILD